MTFHIQALRNIFKSGRDKPMVEGNLYPLISIGLMYLAKVSGDISQLSPFVPLGLTLRNQFIYDGPTI
jgi:hypothetical protein